MAERQDLGSVLQRLSETIESRREAVADTSYTASLLAKGPAHCARKFGEEAVETVIAGAAADKPALVAEAADALYHLMVLLAANGAGPADVAAELERREGVSGHEEKASRGGGEA